MRNYISSTAIALIAFAAATDSGSGNAGDTATKPEEPAKTLTPEEQAAADAAAKIDADKLPYLTDKEKVKAIHDALGGQRQIFSDIETAIGKVKAAAEKTESFYGLPVVSCDKDVPEGYDIYVSTVTKRDKGVNGLRAIVIFPAPTVDMFIEQKKTFVDKQVQKEIADIAFNGIRAAATAEGASESLADLQNKVNGIPLDTESYATANRGAAEAVAFDEMWTDFRAAFIKAKPAFEKAIPSRKPECLKAMRSAAYAESNPATSALEELKKKDAEGNITEDSGWVRILKQFMKAAEKAVDPKTKEPKNYDLEIYQAWIDGRETLNLKYATVEFVDSNELLDAFN